MKTSRSRSLALFVGLMFLLLAPGAGRAADWAWKEKVASGGVVEILSAAFTVESDFGLQVTGRFGPKQVSGTIGAGGRVLHLRSVNGSIQIRRRV